MPSSMFLVSCRFASSLAWVRPVPVVRTNSAAVSAAAINGLVVGSFGIRMVYLPKRGG